MKYRRGFTLIELLVVISIIALLASVVLASLNSARDKGRLAGARYFAAQVDHVAGDQAIGVWDFDDCPTVTTVDRSGYGNTGTLVGTPVPPFSTNTPTGTGCSLGFNGSNQAVTTSLAVTTPSAITISAWVYWVASGAVVQFITAGGPGTEKFEMHAGGGGGSNGLRCIPTPGVYLDTGAGKLPSNQWNHVACVYNPNTSLGKIYINGQDTGAVNDGGSPLTTAITSITAFNIGMRNSGTLFFWGNIDAVHVFTKDLTASEVQKLYASEMPRFKVASR